MRLRVIEVDGTEVHTEVLVGGKVSNHKGINLPGVAVSVPALSEKDIEDLRFALHLTVDFVALSFVRSAADADDVRRVMREEGVMLPVIAKIEKPQAIENLDEVIAAFDGFMVAARRPRRRVRDGGGAVPAEAGDRQGPPQRQAGDRGHPDARVDDHQPPTRRAPRPPTSRTPCSTARTR